MSAIDLTGEEADNEEGTQTDGPQTPVWGNEKKTAPEESVSERKSTDTPTEHTVSQGSKDMNTEGVTRARISNISIRSRSAETIAVTVNMVEAGEINQAKCPKLADITMDESETRDNLIQYGWDNDPYQSDNAELAEGLELKQPKKKISKELVPEGQPF